MTEVFEHYAAEFDEVYEVIKVADVVCKRRWYRFEVLRRFPSTDKPYSVHAWTEADIQLDGDGEPLHAWVRVDRPWVQRETAEGALSQALGFLKDDRRQS